MTRPASGGAGDATDTDRRWLLAAIELSRECPPTDSAYCVGAIVVAADGTRLADGYSRDTDARVHAEESALARLVGADGSLAEAAAGAISGAISGATIYTSMEPCSTRRSRPRTCTELILAAGIRRVVFALREPPLFADCHGVELLREGGAEVIEVSELGGLVRQVNAGVLGPDLAG